MAHGERIGCPPDLPRRPIYLDHNATTPVDTRVVQALLPALGRDFGNPSSAHAFGAAPRAALACARAQVAELVGACAGEIVFTAGGSEADALAIHGVVRAALARRPDVVPHVVTQTTEHPAVLAACASLERDLRRRSDLPAGRPGGAGRPRCGRGRPAPRRRSSCR